jgi:hypothetical protein
MRLSVIEKVTVTAFIDINFTDLVFTVERIVVLFTVNVKINMVAIKTPTAVYIKQS